MADDVKAKFVLDGLDAAAKGLKSVGTAATDLEGDLQDTRSAGQRVADELNAKTELMEQGLRQDVAAAQALAAALGPELAAKIGAGGITDAVTKFKALGLTAEQVTTDADALANAISRLNDVKVNIAGLDSVGPAADSAKSNLDGLEQSARKGKEGVDELGKSGDSSKSALANMVGNSAQDLGNLGGVAGSTGVAIGQMAEYMADARLEGEGLGSVLSSFGAVAAPIAAIGIATQIVSGYLQDVAETKAFNKQRVEDFTEALQDGVVVASELREILSTDGKGQDLMVRIDDESVNAEQSVAKLVGTFTDFAQTVGGGLPAYDAWADSQIAAGQAAGFSSEKLKYLRIVLDDARDGSVNGAQASGAYAVGLTDQLLAAVALASAIAAGGTAATGAAFDAKFYGDAVDGVTASYVASGDQIGEFRARMDALSTSLDGSAVAQEAYDKKLQAAKDHIQAADEASKAYADTLRDEARASKEAADAIQAQIDAAESAADSFLAVGDAEQRLARAKEATDAAYAGGDALTAAAKAEKDALDAVTAAQAKLDAAKAAAKQAGDPAAAAQEEKAAVDALKAAQDRLTRAKQESAKAEGTGDTDLINRAHAEETAAYNAVTAAQQRADAAKASNNGDPAKAAKDEADAAKALADAQAKLAAAKAATAAVGTGPNTKEAVDAVQNERDAIIAAAKAQLRYAEDQAAATGHTLTAAEKIDILNQALQDNARNATPEARQAVYDYIGVLNQIPADKTSQISALVDQGSLDAANQALTDASTTRTAAIVVQADLDSYNAAIAAAVAEDHHTNVTVDATPGQGYHLPWEHAGNDGGGVTNNITVTASGVDPVSVQQAVLEGVRRGLYPLHGPF